MRTLKTLVIVAVLMAVAGPAEAGEAIVLKDGSVYIGDVRDVTADSVIANVEHPAPGEQTFARTDLTDESLWRLLTTRIAEGDAKGRLELGRWAEKRALLTPALFEYQRAEKSPEFAATAGERIRDLESRLAMQLFDEGEELLILGKPASAKQYFLVLIERYPTTSLAQVAKLRVDRAQKEIAAPLAAKKSPGSGDAVLSKSAWDREIAKAVKHSVRAERYEKRAVHGDRSVQQARDLKRAVKHLEEAVEIVQDLGPTPDGANDATVNALRNDIHKRLLKTYLDLGLVYLLRQSIPQAEEWCVKACDLDPQNAESHTLHKRIIEARLASQWGISTHKRISR